MTLIKRIVIVFSLTFSLNVNGQKNCNYKIDTSGILSNENLDGFLLKFQSDSFNISLDKKDIPSFIKRQLDCLADGFSIANPNQKYQATDVIIEKLPRRQLLFLATSKNMIVMTYLIGGRGVSTHILFIKFQGKKIIDLWTGVCFPKLKSKTEIINYINEHRNKEEGLNSNAIYF